MDMYRIIALINAAGGAFTATVGFGGAIASVVAKPADMEGAGFFTLIGLGGSIWVIVFLAVARMTRRRG
jgi:hypothetical protein